jgi:predicted small integral membrane protein
LWLARPTYAFFLAAFLSLAAMVAFELLRPDRRLRPAPN